MNSDVTKLLGKQVCVQITGNNSINGVLTDFGIDILVIYNGQQFLYIPMLHVRRIQFNSNKEEFVNLPSEFSFAEEADPIAYRQILTNAQDKYTEISVIGNLPFHGSITDVLNDYFAFYSPVYKIMYIPFDHLKWLIPYNEYTLPYTLSKVNQTVKVNPSNIPLLLSFEEQLKKEMGKLVVFDGGVDPFKIGLLNNVENNFAEITIASGETVYLKLNHIKSVHLP